MRREAQEPADSALLIITLCGPAQNRSLCSATNLTYAFTARETAEDESPWRRHTLTFKNTPRKLISQFGRKRPSGRSFSTSLWPRYATRRRLHSGPGSRFPRYWFLSDAALGTHIGLAFNSSGYAIIASRLPRAYSDE